RMARPDCVRMLVTAYPDVNTAILAINRGQVNRYIAKPFDSAELRVAIAQELEHQDLLHQNRKLNQEMGRMVDELFKANRELRERARKKSLRVRVAWPRKRVPIRADERKIHGVLTNVLANAEKFTPEDARIEIRVGPAKKGKCRVLVIDNGSGPEKAEGGIQL